MKPFSSKPWLIVCGAVCAIALILLGAAAPPNVTPRYDVQFHDSKNDPYAHLTITDHVENKVYIYYALMQSAGVPKNIELRSSIDLSSVGEPQLRFAVPEKFQKEPAEELDIVAPVD